MYGHNCNMVQCAALQPRGWKRDQHLLFFSRSLAWPPSPYLPNIVCFLHIYVFSDVFWSSNIVFDISNLHGAYYYGFYTINGTLWSWLCSWGMSSYKVWIGNPYTWCETMCHCLWYMSRLSEVQSWALQTQVWTRPDPKCLGPGPLHVWAGHK